jgi:hypothetical protein
MREAPVSQRVNGAIARVTTYREIDEARAGAERHAE